MQITRIAPIGLLALAILAPSARAQKNQTTIKLAQTAKLVTHPHPGVNADILGVHIGMTVSQAEAIAAKSYPGKPKVDEYPPDLAYYRGITAYSQRFVGSVYFVKNNSDSLTLYFSSPATGNVVYAMFRSVDFNNPLTAPLLSTLKSSLIKKYGPSSFHNGVRYIWQFGKKSFEHCSPTRSGGAVPCDVESLLNGDPGENGEAFTRSGVAMGISAQWNASADNTKVGLLDVTVQDYQDQEHSISLTTKLLKDAAIKYYKKTVKTPGVKL